MIERIRTASKSLRNHRANRINKMRIRFWYETKSGNQINTEDMSKEEAEVFLETCNCYIVGIMIIDRMDSERAMEYLKVGKE